MHALTIYRPSCGVMRQSPWALLGILWSSRRGAGAQSAETRINNPRPVIEHYLKQHICACTVFIWFRSLNVTGERTGGVAQEHERIQQE